MGTVQLLFEVVVRGGGATGSDRALTGSDVSHMTESGPDRK